MCEVFGAHLVEKDGVYVIKTSPLTAEEENYMDNLKQQIDQLEKTYKDAKKEDLMRNRTEISQLLKDAILLHYYYRKGCIEGALADDPDVKKAVEILTNPTEYNRILNK